MAEEENTNQPPYRSLDEVKAAIRELQAGEQVVEPEGKPASNGQVKLDADGDELLFIGEAGPGHNCRAMRCELN